MNSFNTQIQIEEIEMNEPIYYDIEREEYLTEKDLRNEYEDYLEEQDNDRITFEQFVNNCLTTNNGTLEKVGF